MKKIHCTLLVVLALLAVACENDTNGNNPDNGPKKDPETGLKTVTYQLSNDEIVNPERGLFTQYESNAKDYVALSYLRKLRSEGKTLGTREPAGLQRLETLPHLLEPAFQFVVPVNGGGVLQIGRASCRERV